MATALDLVTLKVYAKPALFDFFALAFLKFFIMIKLAFAKLIKFLEILTLRSYVLQRFIDMVAQDDDEDRTLHVTAFPGNAEDITSTNAARHSRILQRQRSKSEEIGR